jgi:hypothetical protein
MTGYTAVDAPDDGSYAATVLYNVDVGAATAKTLDPSAGYMGYAVAIKAGGSTSTLLPSAVSQQINTVLF